MNESDPRDKPRVIRDAEDTLLSAEVQLDFKQDLGKKPLIERVTFPIAWLRKKRIETKMKEFMKQNKPDQKG